MSKLSRVLNRSAKTGAREQDAYQEIYEGAGPFHGNAESGSQQANTGSKSLECPICQAVNDRFLTFGLDRRPYAQCPNCGSLERHRILWLYLTDRTDILRKPRRLLHTGPEPCFEPTLRSSNGTGYCTTDRYDRSVDVAADLKALPFSDHAFDAILSSHVLEHIEDDGKALREFGRVLQPGGQAIIMVPYDPDNPTYCDPELKTPAERMAAYGHPYHYRIYGHDLLDRLADVGLATRAWSAKELFSPARRRRHRLNNNYLLACEKT